MPTSETSAQRDKIFVIQGLSLDYRSGFLERRTVHAVRDLDLELRRGEVLAVVGPNGSGKTTLFRSLVGLIKPARGKIDILGGKPGQKLVLEQIGYLAEGRLPLGRLSAYEFLTLRGTLRRMPVAKAKARARDLLDEMGLAGAARRPHASYSTGMARRLAFAHALFHKPELLILDEPTAGLDPEAVGIVRSKILEHAKTGGSCILATHGLEDFADSFDRILVLLDGKALASGSAEDILAMPGRLNLEVEGLEVEGLPGEELESGVLDGIRRKIEEAGGRLIGWSKKRQDLGSFLRNSQEQERGQA